MPAVRAGDAWATQVVLRCTRPLARTLLTVAMAAGLERVFVIGGFAQALGSCYIKILRHLSCEYSRYDVVHERLGSMFELASEDCEMCLEGCAAFLRSRRSGPWS